MSRPEHLQLEPCYVYVKTIFDNLDSARAAMRTAMDSKKLKHPDHAIWYRDAIDKLGRLEAQVDALTYVFQKEREELRQWLVDMLAWYKELEAQEA